MIKIRNLSAVLASVVLASTANAQAKPGISDFLATIGGDTSMKTINSIESRPSPEIYPLLRHRADIVDYRFFSEQLRENGSATADRAKAAFAGECVAKGGAVEPDGSPTAQRFHGYTVGGKLPRRGSFKHFWVGQSAVCSSAGGQALGGFVAVTFDTTEVNAGKSIASLLGNLVPKTPTRTAVYAYGPWAITSRAEIERTDALRVTRLGERDRSVAAFQHKIEVGTETNCGTVIQVRGPMAEVAVPTAMTTPNGQSSFWSKRERLFPPANAICTFGL